MYINRSGFTWWNWVVAKLKDEVVFYMNFYSTLQERTYPYTGGGRDDRLPPQAGPWTRTSPRGPSGRGTTPTAQVRPGA